MVVAPTDTFPAEEYGSGRLTPLVQAPDWVQARARREAALDGDRATLTPSDQAFLESPPAYEEGGAAPLLSLPAPPLPSPSLARSIMAKLLFVAIAGGACLVLGLALLRMLGRAIE
jgi:hypothetical protein